MIVTRKKDMARVRGYLEGCERLVIIGCSECAAVCRTGGSEQVSEMKEALGDRKVLATISIESPCDKRITSRDLKRLSKELGEADAVVALTCGSGSQAIAEVTSKPVVTALDTGFLGMVERLGHFLERCSHCGDCLLNDTAGICPVTRCPKSLRNGPCEGVAGTRCDVDDEQECVWHLIYRELERTGRGDRFTAYHEPPDWRNRHSPRREIQERQK